MSTAWGNARATYFCRGIALPPRGSFQDELMQTMLERERSERLTAAETTLIGMAMLQGMDRHKAREFFRQTLQSYQDELTHKSYDMARLRMRLVQSLQKQRKDDDLLKKVSKMGE